MITKTVDTLATAKAEVFTGMQKSKGITCPCCEQKVKLYKRQITSSMAYQLVCLAKVKTVGFIHVEKWRSNVNASGGTMGGGEHSKLQFWGLIETDGKGYWKITQEGREFAFGQGTVRKFARIFNNTFLGFDGPQVTIQGCLGVRYMLADLLAA
jgi:hypothetical protein